jgi:hypothetical protein
MTFDFTVGINIAGDRQKRERLRRRRLDRGAQGEARNDASDYQLRTAQQQVRRSPPPAQIDHRRRMSCS